MSREKNAMIAFISGYAEFYWLSYCGPYIRLYDDDEVCNPMKYMAECTCITYKAYPQNKFRLQILPLQHCGHNGAHACRVCWSFGKARTQFADNQTVFTHCPVCLQCSRKSRSQLHVLCNLFLECKKHETAWHSLSTLWGVWRTCHEWFNGTVMGETL
jgi:hypothetical protein